MKYFIQETVRICPLCGAHLSLINNGVDYVYRCADITEHIFVVTGEGISDRELEAELMKDIQEKYHKICLRCGRKLRNQQAQLRGYGEVCWKKQLKISKKRLF